MVTTFIFQFGQQFFKPLSHPNGFYWGHQSLWTFTPANSMQSNDRNRKKPGQMQSLNLLCSTNFWGLFCSASALLLGTRAFACNCRGTIKEAKSGRNPSAYVKQKIGIWKLGKKETAKL